MVVGLLGNESPDSNRLTLVTPKPENGVRLQATLDNQNPTGLPVGAVRKDVEQSGKYDRVLMIDHAWPDLEIAKRYGWKTHLAAHHGDDAVINMESAESLAAVIRGFAAEEGMQVDL